METLFALFERHLIGTRANAAETVKVAMGAVRAFAVFVGRPPWAWEERDLDEFLAHKVTEDHIGLSRQAAYITYLRAFQHYVLDSVGLKNEIHQRFGVQPQRYVTNENAIPIKRKQHAQAQRRGALSAEQCQALIDAFDAQIELAEQTGSKSFCPLRRDKAAVMLMLLTGIRVEELLTIKIQDWMADPAHPNFGGYAVLSVYGKGRKRRQVRLYNPIIKDLMEWYMVEVRPHFLGEKTTDPTLLILSERGCKLSEEQIRRSLRNVASLAMIPYRVTPHMLRHTYATEMMQPIGAEAVQKQLGHVYLSTTLGTYYHSDIERTGCEVAHGIDILAAIEPQTAQFNHADHIEKPPG